MIGDLVQRITATKPEPPTELVNDPADLCECGACGCNSPLIDPNRKRP